MSKNVKTDKPAPEDLGLLRPVKELFAIALPSTATGIIVSYDRDEYEDYESVEIGGPILITCSFPSQKMELLANKREIASKSLSAAAALKQYKKQKIKIPATLFSMELTDIPSVYDIGTKVESYYLFAHNTKFKKGIEAIPFAISNVFDNGAICFGDFKPKSLKEAYNTFWNSPFNDELIDEHAHHFGGEIDDETTVDEYMRFYVKNVFKELGWEDYTNLFCGKKFWASPEGAAAVLISSDKDLLKQIPEKYWRVNQGIPIIICKVTKLDTEWLCESGSYKFKLHADFLTTTPFRRKKSKNP